MFLDRPAGFFCVAALFHLLYCLCAFDLYFQSPLRQAGAPEPRQSQLPPLAKRVVFVTLDGAPAEILLAAMQRDLIAERGGVKQDADPKRATLPFLASLFNDTAPHGSMCWGIMHSHTPTESRPAHIALVSGMYEDPSAVRTGWDWNVDMSFDTVWKEATWAWQWGAPEIVGLFDTAPHIKTHAFPSTMKHPFQVDNWVARGVKAFFEGAANDTALAQRLHADRVVFFWHFLGIDTMGHANGTQSKMYLEVMRNADASLRDAVGAINKFYNDSDTAFVVTSDHGMEPRGVHGDGTAAVTRSPIFVFGAGVNSRCRTAAARARRGSSGIKHSEGFAAREEEVAYTRERWIGAPEDRIDLEPADVSILMASLLSSPLPVHSEGTVPLDYLVEDDVVRAHAALANVEQARARVAAAAAWRRAQTAGWCTPWPETTAAEEQYQQLQRHLHANDLPAVIAASDALIARYRAGSTYYREYDQAFMILAVGFAYLTWVLYSASMVTPTCGFRARDFIPLGLGYAAVVPLVYVQGMTVRDGCYLVAPFHLLPFVVRQGGEVVRFFRREMGMRQGAAAAVAVVGVGMGFQERYVLSFVLVGAGIAALFCHSVDSVVGMALFACAVFPSLPALRGAALMHLVAPSGALLGGGVLLAARKWKELADFTRPACLVLFASALVALSDATRATKAGTPPLLFIASWLLLAVSIVLPRLRPPTAPRHHLAHVLLSLHPPLILLSVGYEPLLMMALSALLLSVERHLKQRLSVTAQGTMLMFLVYFAFFATGNIASISSFDLPSAHRLTGHADRGTQSVCLVVKVWIPLVAIFAAFVIMNDFSVPRIFSVVAAAVGLSDVVALAFFATMRTSGSWKEIGHTLTRFLIANLLTLILLIVWGLAALVTRPVKGSFEAPRDR